MRHISWFSCGAASAVATKLALQKNEIEIVRCVVKEEHPDNDRFAEDCEKWFGQKIVNLIAEEYDGSIYKVFEKRGYISGIQGAPCTYLLKKRLRLTYERPDDVHIFGYTADEQSRFDRFLDANNIDVQAPLIEKGLTHDECLAIVQDAGIELPVMYHLGYKHNNCIGCAKAQGAGYWNKIRKDFPNEFQRMASLSRRLGARMTRVGNKRIFLDELPEGVGRYMDEPEIQCGIFCEAVKDFL